VRFAYAGMAEPVTVEAGSCISQPTGVPHNVVGRSDDLEAIEINIPGEHGTFSPP
jgi:mannose-6-phosphate isomerase-like protein (cupin superfamily)